MGKPYIKTTFRLLAFVGALFFSGVLNAQNSVSIGTDQINANAVLWLQGNGSQGFILPVVSGTGSISGPESGMVVFDQSSNTVQYFNGTAWVGVGSGSGGGSTYGLSYSNGVLTLIDGGTANQITVSLLGDVTGDADATTVSAIQGRNVASTAPSDTQVLAWNAGSNQWEPTTIGAVTGDGWGSDVVNTNATLTGDGTSGSPLGVNSISTAQISDISSAGSGSIITNAERTKLTNITGTNTGDEVVFNATTDGLVPAPGASTGRVLQDDGTWVTVSGSGDMTKSVYDTNADDVVDLAATVTTNANLTGPVTSVGNATSITNGAITNAMLANGAVANLSGTNTGDEVLFNATTDGIVPAPGASTGRVLQDDGTWVTPSGGGDLLSTNNLSDLADAATSRTNLGLGTLSTLNTITTAEISDITSVGSGSIITNAERTNLSNQSGTNTGDEVIFDATNDGIVPSPGASTGRVLQDDGTWVTISASGDMLKSTYDTNADDVVDLAATVTTNANLTGPVTSVGNATSIASGAITNTMLENTAVANLSGTNTGDEVLFDATNDGIVPSPGASTGRVLQDDGTWVTPTTGATDLSGLSDALVTTPADAQILVYDGTTDNQFENVSLGGDISMIADGTTSIQTTAGNNIVSAINNASTTQTVNINRINPPGGTDKGFLTTDGTTNSWLTTANANKVFGTDQSNALTARSVTLSTGAAIDNTGVRAAGSASDANLVSEAAVREAIDAAAGGSLQDAYDGGNTITLNGTDLEIYDNSSSIALYLDENSGNLGIGTLSAFSQLQISDKTHLQNANGGTLLAHNMYYDGSNYVRTNAGYATSLVMGDGTAAFIINNSDAAGVNNGTGLSNILTINETGVAINTLLSPHPSAVLDVQNNYRSTPGGFRMPTMTQTDRDAIVTPADGLMIYNTDDKAFNFYNNGTASWEAVGGGSSTLQSAYDGGNTIDLNGADFSIRNSTGTSNHFRVSDVNGNILIGESGNGYAVNILKSSDALIDMISSNAAIDTQVGLRMSMSTGAIGTVYRVFANKNDNTGGSTDADFIMRKEFSTGGGYLEFLKYENATGNVYLNGDNTSASSYGDIIISGGNLGIQNAAPTVGLDVNTTDAIKIPVGTTAERPVSPAAGMLRYNTTDAQYEAHNGSGWSALGGGSSSLQSAYDGGKIIELDGANAIEVNNSGQTEQFLNLDNNGTLRLGDASTSFAGVRHQISVSNTSNLPLVHVENQGTGDASIRYWQGGLPNTYSMGVDGTDGYFKVSNGNQLGTNDRLVIDNNGFVGVGTATPAGQFDLTGNQPRLFISHRNSIAVDQSALGYIQAKDGQTTNVQAGLNFFRDGASSGATDVPTGISFLTTADGTSTAVERMRISNQGYVGIGDTDPSSSLTIKPKSSGDGILLNPNGANMPGITWADADVSNKIIMQAPNDITTSYNLVLPADAGTNGQVLTTDGSGTTSWSSTSGDNLGNHTATQNVVLGSNYLSGDGGSEGIFVDAAGEVGIGGINNPNYPLEIYGGASNDAVIQLTNGSTGRGITQGLTINQSTTNNTSITNHETASIFFGTNGSTRMTIDAAGEVGIGITAPDEALDVSGNAEVTGEYMYSAAKTRYYSSGPGEFQSNATQSYDMGKFLWTATTRYTVFINGTGGSIGYASAGVHLPHGAIVTGVDAFLWRNDGTSSIDPTIKLVRHQMGANTDGTLATCTATVDMASVQTISAPSIVNATIDNSTYDYSLVFSADQSNGNMRLYGVRITYTVTQAD